MRQMAIYGKGGIGKSMVSSHISFALAEKGLKVMHVGCDPKHDSTRLLLNGKMPKTILSTLREKNFKLESVSPEELIFQSPFTSQCRGEIYCAESGGPEPGVGCGGRGVIEAIETLKRLNVFEDLALDVVLYDLLGDVVCGGFSMPIREGYAEEIYIVSSGEFEALFAASNICKAISRFSGRSGAQLGGIIGNLRDLKQEKEILEEFAALIGTHVNGFIPYREIIKECSGRGVTLFQLAPESAECDAFGKLADAIWNNEEFSVPGSLKFEDLHAWWSEAAGMANTGSVT